MIGGIAVAAIAAVMLTSFRGRAGVATLSVQRVTGSNGLTMMPMLSPDGRMVAYASDGGHDGTTLQIFLQQIDSTASVQLTRGAEIHIAPSFSADGTRILFTRSDGVRADLYEMPTVGGEPRLLIADGGIGWFSPDGKWLQHLGIRHAVWVAPRNRRWQFGPLAERRHTPRPNGGLVARCTTAARDRAARCRHRDGFLDRQSTVPPRLPRDYCRSFAEEGSTPSGHRLRPGSQNGQSCFLVATTRVGVCGGRNSTIDSAQSAIPNN